MSKSRTGIRRSVALLGTLALALACSGLALPANTPAQATSPAIDATASAPGILKFTANSPAGTPWIVPAGVHSIDATIVSATGGATGFTGGGGGTEAKFIMNVQPGDELMLYGSTAGGLPKTRDGGKGYHNGGRGGDKSSSAAVGAGGAGSSALLQNGELVAEVGGGGGSGGESNNRCKHCGPYGNKNIGGAGGKSGENGRAGNGDIAGVPGLAGQHANGNGSNGKSAATLSQGGGGGGGGGGFVGASGGGAGRSALGTGSGGGGGGGGSWYHHNLFGLTEKTVLRDIDPGYVTLTYQSGTRISVSAPAQVASDTPFDVIVQTKNLNIPSLVPSGDLTISVPNETPLITQAISSADTRVTIPGLPSGTHNLLARISPTDGSSLSGTSFTVEVTPGDDEPIVGSPVDTTTTVSAAAGSTFGSATQVTANVAPAMLGVTPTGSVQFSLNGVDQGGVVSLDASGTATASLPAQLNAGIYQLQAHYSGDSMLEPSTSEPVELIIERAPTVVTVTPSVTNLVFGTPLTVNLAAATVDGHTQPSGVIALMTGEGLLRLAELNGGSATIENVILPYGTTELYASYAGDVNGNFAESVSDPAVSVTVTAAPTTTALAVDRAEAMSGHGHTFTATVNTGAMYGSDPRGSIEILLDGEVIDTSAVGGDVDTRENNGIAQYTLTTDQVPNGTHQVTARFVPAVGFVASTSEALTVTAVPWSTETTASVLAPARGDATQSRLTVDVRTITPETSASQGETPIAWGTVQAFIGDDVSHENAVSDPVEVGGGTQTLDLRGLTSGTHLVTLLFLPDSTATLPSEATISVTIPAGGASSGGQADSAQNTSASQSSDPHVLASTGSTASVGGWIAAAALVLGAFAALAFSRRSRCAH